MKTIVGLKLFVLSALFLTTRSTQAVTLYGGGAGQRTLYAIDPTTGARNNVKDFKGTTFRGINGLAFNSNDGFLYATTTQDLSDAAAGRIYRLGVTSNSFDSFPISGLPSPLLSSLDGLEYDSIRNVFWATLIPTNALLQISADSFTATVVGLLPPFSQVGGLAFDTQTDTLYGVNGAGVAGGGLSKLVIIDKVSAALTDVGPAGLGQLLIDLDSLAFNPIDRMLYSINDNSNVVTQPYAQQLVRIDPSTGMATLVGPLPQRVLEEVHQGLAFVVPEPALSALAWAAGAFGAVCRRIILRRQIA